MTSQNQSITMIKILPPKLFKCKIPLFAAEENNVLEMKLLFEKAVAETNSINIRTGEEILIRLYSLYKQATRGDIDIEPPGTSFDHVEKAKYDAWASLKGKSIKEAQCEFIVLVHELKN